MSRSSAVSVLPSPSDEGEEEEEAEGGEEVMDGASDPDSDAGGDMGGDEEEEEEVVEEEEMTEVEEEVLEVEEEDDEEEEADGGEEESEEGEEAEEASREMVGDDRDEDREEREEEEELGDAGGEDSPPEFPASADKDVDDASQEIKSEGQDKDPKLIHSLRNKSEANSMSNTLVGDALLEKERSVEILNVQNEHEIPGDQKPSSNKNSVNAERPESLHLEEKEFVELAQKRCRNGDLDGVRDLDGVLHLEKEVSSIDRPRSPVAGFHEDCNKRPAVSCAFFARGWCIKGNSCRFLHHKDGDDASQAAKDNLTGTGSHIDLKEDTGLKHNVGRVYSPQSLMSTAENSPSLQRALVRAYGGHELHGFQEKDSQSLFQTDSSLGTKAQNAGVQLATTNGGLFPDWHRTTYADGTSIGGGGRRYFHLSELPRTPLIQTDVKSYDASPGSEKLDSHFNSIDGRQSMTGGFISRKYLGEGKTHHELSRLEYANDASFSKGSPVMKNSLIPEYKYCSSTSLMSPSNYMSGKAPHANDRSSADSVAHYQGPPSLHDPNTSYFTKGMFHTGFQNSPSHIAPSSDTLTQITFHSTCGSVRLSTEDVCTYKRLDYERGYHGSRSSSPFSQVGQEKFQQQEIAGSNSVSAERRVHSLGDGWEPSMPFRSSFYCPPASISSPGSQYDPLSDSIDPPQALSNQHKNIDYVPKGSEGPGYSDLNLEISFHKSHESIVGKSNSEYGAGGYPSSNAGVSASVTVDGLNRSSMPKEKSWSPGHVIDIGNLKEADYEDNLRNQEDKVRQHKESKALKNFRACLVEFVKDLVKPAWREGHLSKDAHKMVVKKAAEKVLSALQSHQVPGTTDAINQYLSASRPKIAKLVEGYVDKYAKS